MRNEASEASSGCAARKGSAKCGRKGDWHNALHWGMVAAAAVLPLSGCATTRYSVAYCLTPPQLQKLKGAEPKRIGSSLTGRAQTDLKIIAGNDLELRTYSDGLLGVLGGCVDPNKPVQ